jgi:hypothetical protein
MTDKTFEVVVPMYGYMTLVVEADSAAEAKEKAFEDCLNVSVDQSEMEETDDNFMLMPHEEIHKGNTSFIPHSELSAREVEGY